MKNISFILFLLIPLLLTEPIEPRAGNASSITADDSRAITWMMFDMPPVFIHKGPFRGMGYEDVIQKILIENLPEYEHRYLIGNLSRNYYEFKQKNQVCNVAFYKTPEREKFLFYSIPNTLTLPNRLVVKKERIAEFSPGAEISLEKILEKGIYQVGVAEKRSYGKSLDAVLNRHSDSIYRYNGQDLFESLLKMLLADRIDAVLGLPEEVNYMAETLGVKGKITILSLAESRDGYDTWIGHVVCSKTDWGREVIAKIDRILLKERPTERYRRAYERWLDKESVDEYRQLYDEIFLKFHEQEDLHP